MLTNIKRGKGINPLAGGMWEFFKDSEFFNIYSRVDPHIFNNTGIIQNLDSISRRVASTHMVTDKKPDLEKTPSFRDIVENHKISLFVLDENTREYEKLTDEERGSYFMVNHGRDCVTYNIDCDPISFTYYGDSSLIAPKKLRHFYKLQKASIPIEDF